jgi:hypothetical protein
MGIFKGKSAFALIYAAFACGLICLMTSGGLGISADSESYLVTANRFTQQRWGESLNPYWPPLYPLSIAAVKATGLAGLLGAARIVSVFSFIISIVTIYLLGLELGKRFVAHFSVISSLFLASMIFLFCFCWSETLYIMVSLLLFLVLTRLLRSPEGEETRYLILSGIFSGLGTITRFVGCSLIGTGVLCILFLSNHKPKIKKLKESLAFISAASIPVFLYFLGCLHYYGLTGKKQFPSPYSFSHQLLQFPITFYHDFLTFDLMFWKYTLFFDWKFPFFWPRAFVLISLVIFLFLFIKAICSAQLQKSEFRSLGGLMVYVVLYISTILVTSSTVAIDPIGSRFTVPVYPFVLLLVFSAISYIWKTSIQAKLKHWFLGMAILSLGIFWSMQLVSTISIYKGISTGSFPAIEHPGNLNRGSIKFLKQNAGPSDYIISNVYRKLTFIWPRQEPYLYATEENWGKSIDAIMIKASQRTVYFLISTQDFAPDKITVEDLDKADHGIGLFAWKKDFGNDYLYKTKQVVLQSPQGSKEGE